jgi:hypothetical protein
MRLRCGSFYRAALGARSARLVPVMLGMELGSLHRVMRGVGMMAVGGVRMMRSGLVVTRFMMPRRFAVMLRRMLMMLRRFVMVMHCFVRHISSYPSGLPEELHYPAGNARRGLLRIHEARMNGKGESNEKENKRLIGPGFHIADERQMRTANAPRTMSEMRTKARSSLEFLRNCSSLEQCL